MALLRRGEGGDIAGAETELVALLERPRRTDLRFNAPWGVPAGVANLKSRRREEHPQVTLEMVLEALHLLLVLCREESLGPLLALYNVLVGVVEVLCYRHFPNCLDDLFGVSVL